ncbi:MAG: DUF4160 domain-containing protein [Treponema sp.]|uniref:DUF4160 domain-containing protein n=1 Tax=Treponema sp. TaxID=166 RepID=UPI0025CEABB4|nr:DUF4160 domain-containing protein [Treponema sp.]MBR0496202.1 DUF4160 domain-containing protein [Treponema sp.]
MNLLQMGEAKLPSIFKIGSYAIYFWSNENCEPVHIHVAKGNPVPNATKVWLTSTGGCILANNNSRIPEHQLNNILKIVSDQFFLICSEWQKHFGKNMLKFYA